MKQEFDNMVTFIRPQRGWRLIDLGELVRYRDLLYFLTVRGIKAKYAQSILGVSWAIIQPLFSTLVFTVVFGNLAQVSSDGVPYFMFSLVAIVPWLFFSTTLTEASNSLVANASMISKVYFPRLILPLSSALSKSLDFSIGMIMIVIAMIVFKVPFTIEALLIPLLVLLLLIASLGLSMLFSALAVQYRDVKHALSFAVQLLMYAAPVVYPTSKIPERFRDIYALDPMVGVIEGFRSVLLHTQPFPTTWVLIGTAVAVATFVVGLLSFRKMERLFADVV